MNEHESMIFSLARLSGKRAARDTGKLIIDNPYRLDREPDEQVRYAGWREGFAEKRKEMNQD